MSSFLTYIFWPNPGNADYTSPKAIALIVLCAALIIASFVWPRVRQGSPNVQLRKISASWGTAAGWFGWMGLILVVARVEEIQFIAMRFLWLVWGGALLAYLFVQFRLYRMRYYDVIPSAPLFDARAQYLPKKKKR